MKMNYIKPEMTVMTFGSNQLLSGSITGTVNGSANSDDIELGSKSNGSWDED